MSDPLNELLIIGPLVAKIQVADILDWVSPLFSYVTYRDGERDALFISTYAYRSLDRLLSVDFPKDTSYFVIAERGTLIGGILWEGTRFDGTNPKAVLK